MQKVLKISGVIIIALLVMPWLAYAQNGGGDCSTPIHEIVETVDLEGEIISLNGKGSGFTLATDSENLKVFGLGPEWYWDSLGVERPVVGDTIQVTCLIRDYNGEERYVAGLIILGEEIITLRSPEGFPLWRFLKKKIAWHENRVREQWLPQ